MQKGTLIENKKMTTVIHNMKTKEVVKILEENRITNVGKNRPYNVESDRILIGSDHRGYSLKKDIKIYLLKNKHRIVDVGTYNEEATDYPSIAQTLCRELLDDRIETTRGILICGSGYGMSMAANRYKEIYAITARTVQDTEIARQHGNINVLCLGADFTTEPKAELLLDTFLHTDFEGGRHGRRIEMMDR